jgi:hypothetical protein
MHSLSVEHRRVNRNFAKRLKQSAAGKRMRSIVYSSLDRHIVHLFWIAMLAPSCGAAQVM